MQGVLCILGLKNEEHGGLRRFLLIDLTSTVGCKVSSSFEGLQFTKPSDQECNLFFESSETSIF